MASVPRNRLGAGRHGRERRFRGPWKQVRIPLTGSVILGQRSDIDLRAKDEENLNNLPNTRPYIPDPAHTLRPVICGGSAPLLERDARLQR